MALVFSRAKIMCKGIYLCGKFTMAAEGPPCMTFLGHNIGFPCGMQQSKVWHGISCFALVHFAIKTSRSPTCSQEGSKTPQTHCRLLSAYHHQRSRLLFFAQRKANCKKAGNQDLTDHRALRQQLRTIRTASVEE